MSQRLNDNAASPAGMKALGTVYGYARQSGLPPRLVDRVFLRVSQINGCAYCIDLHSRDLLNAGSVFDEEEGAALAWAEAVTRLGEAGVSDSAFGAAATVFDEKQLTNLTVAVGLMNACDRLAIIFRARPGSLGRSRHTRTIRARRAPMN